MRLGIDLGGTKIALVVLNSAGEPIYEARCATPKNDYQKTLAAIAGLVNSAGEITAHTPLGIGTPGSQSPKTGLMRNCNSTCLNGQALQQDLHTLLQRPVALANDANCFALSEASNGAAKHHDTVFGVILGTGVGAGLVINKQPVNGRNAIGGEWGHNPVPWAVPPAESRKCYCGQFNCVETWLSGPGFEKTFLARTGRALSSKAISEHAQAGEAQARTALAEYTEQLASALAVVINIVDPEAIVLGGGVGQAWGVQQGLKSALADKVFSDSFQTDILQPAFGAASGVRGAAFLFPDS